MLADLAAKDGVPQPGAQACIASAGGVQLLEAHVQECEGRVAASAAFALGSLALENSSNQAEIATAGGIPRLVALAQLGSPPSIDARTPSQLQGAAWAIGNAGMGHWRNARAIESAGGISALVTILRCLARVPNASPTTEVVEGAVARALGDLAWGDAVTQATIQQAGSVTLLQNIARTRNTEDTRIEATGALSELGVTVD